MTLIALVPRWYTRGAGMDHARRCANDDTSLLTNGLANLEDCLDVALVVRVVVVTSTCSCTANPIVIEDMRIGLHPSKWYRVSIIPRTLVQGHFPQRARHNFDNLDVLGMNSHDPCFCTTLGCLHLSLMPFSPRKQRCVGSRFMVSYDSATMLGEDRLKERVGICQICPEIQLCLVSKFRFLNACQFSTAGPHSHRNGFGGNSCRIAKLNATGPSGMLCFT